MAIARVDNLHQLWGVMIVAAFGIGGIVVPASIITTIICPDVSCLQNLPSFARLLSSSTFASNGVPLLMT